MEEGGNDYTLAEKVKEMGGYAHQVNTWEDTFELLGEVENDNHCMEVFIPGFHD